MTPLIHATPPGTLSPDSTDHGYGAWFAGEPKSGKMVGRNYSHS